MDNMSLLVAFDKNGLIGCESGLPWNIPDDLAFVKKITTGGTIIMGRKNFESIGRALPDRRNIILTSDNNFTAVGCEIFHNKNDILEAVENTDDVFVFGGRQIYELFLENCDTLIVTIIDHEFEGDVYFPDIDWTIWEETALIVNNNLEINNHPFVTKFFMRK